MSDDQTFLGEILANPDEDGPRMVYADWLTEQGDPRGEFIRLQCQRELPSTNDSQRKKLRSRELALLKTHRKEWSCPVSGVADQWDFRRGFVSSIRMSLQKWLKHADELFKFSPIDEIDLRLGANRVKKLADCRHLARIRSLTLKKCRMEDKGIAILLDSPHLETLQKLELYRAGLGDNGAARIGSCERLSNLRILSLESNRIGARGVAALVNSEHFTRLISLDLKENWIGDDGVVMIACGASISQLERLNLAGTHYGASGIHAFADSDRLPSLKWLNLAQGQGSRFGGGPADCPAVANAMANATHMSLEWLSLAAQGIEEGGARALAESPNLKALCELDLSMDAISDEGACHFAESPLLSQLRKLDLEYNNIGINGMETLASSPYLKRRSALHLGGNSLSADGIIEAQKRFGKTFGHL